MDTPTLPSATPPEAPVTPSAAPATTKVLGVERRLIGFGFGLLLVLVALAVVYSQFTRQPMPTSVDTGAPKAMQSDTMKSQSAAPTSLPSAAQEPVTGTVTPDRVVDDLLKEAAADSSDLSQYDADEQADVEEGSNN